MQQEGNTYLRVQKVELPPFHSEMFECLSTLTKQGEFAYPSLASVDVENETITTPAGIMFLQESWFKGVEAFHLLTMDPDNNTKTKLINKGLDIVCDTEDLDFYIWSVWVDLYGFHIGKDIPKETWLRSVAKKVALMGYDIAQADRAGGC